MATRHASAILASQPAIDKMIKIEFSSLKEFRVYIRAVMTVEMVNISKANRQDSK